MLNNTRTRYTFMRKKVILVNNSTVDLKSISFSLLEAGKFFLQFKLFKITSPRPPGRLPTYTWTNLVGSNCAIGWEVWWISLSKIVEIRLTNEFYTLSYYPKIWSRETIRRRYCEEHTLYQWITSLLWITISKNTRRCSRVGIVSVNICQQRVHNGRHGGAQVVCGQGVKMPAKLLVSFLPQFYVTIHSRHGLIDWLYPVSDCKFVHNFLTRVLQ